MCRFKFRLWNCCRSAKVSWTARLHKAIKLSGHSAMLWLLFVLLYSSLHTNPTKTALSHPLHPVPHSCLPCQREVDWRQGTNCCFVAFVCDISAFFIYQTFLPSRRRDCFPTPPSMRFSALSLSLFVGWGSVCAQSSASLPCLPLPLHQCLQFSECFKTIKYQG